nr:hypothetical protein [Streptomyces specialis]
MALGIIRVNSSAMEGGSGAEAVARVSTQDRSWRSCSAAAAILIPIHGVNITDLMPSSVTSSAMRSTSSTAHSTRVAGVLSAMERVVALDVVPSGIGASSGFGSPSWRKPSGPRPKVRLPCGVLIALARPVVPEV